MLPILVSVVGSGDSGSDCVYVCTYIYVFISYARLHLKTCLG